MQKQIVEKDYDDSEDRIEPGSHKENPEFVDNGDDKEEEKQNDDMGSLEIRNEETQTTIPTPPSSPRKILSSDKKIDQKMMDIEFNAHAPEIIEELFKSYVQSNVVHVHPTTITSMETDSSAALQYQLYLKLK
ncbi:hypothetical protein Tco_1462256 [Tanacetum coccineum]